MSVEDNKRDEKIKRSSSDNFYIFLYNELTAAYQKDTGK